MKKLSEMTMNELSACLCKMASPAQALFSDGMVLEAFDGVQEVLNEQTTVSDALGIFTGVLLPVLTDDKHKADTYAILAAQNGQSVEEIEARNGYEVVRELFSIFMVERDVQTIFRPCAQARG